MLSSDQPRLIATNSKKNIFHLCQCKKKKKRKIHLLFEVLKTVKKHANQDSLSPTQMIAWIWWLQWTVCIYWHIMILSIFIIISEMIRKRRKNFDQMKLFDGSTIANIRLDKDILRLRFQKTSWLRPIYSSWPYFFKTSCKNVFETPSTRLSDILKTSSRRLAKTSSRSLQNVFNTSWKSVFKTSSRRLAKIPSRRWRIIKLNCLPRSRICLGHTSEKFMVSVENLQVW